MASCFVVVDDDVHARVSASASASASAAASFQYLDATDWNDNGASWSNPTQQLGADPDWFQETYVDTADADSDSVQLHSFESGFDVDDQEFKDFLQDLEAAAPPPPTIVSAADSSFDLDDSLDLVISQEFIEFYNDLDALLTQSPAENILADPAVEVAATPQWVSVPNAVTEVSWPATPPKKEETFRSSSGDSQNTDSSTSLRHKKYTHWTEEEHRLFLVGLEICGPGKWSKIATNFLPSKTPSQISSHAQKYFLKKRKENILFKDDLDVAAPPPPAMNDSFDIDIDMESLDFEVVDQIFKDILGDDSVAVAKEVPIADVDTPQSQWVPVSQRRIPAPEENQTFNDHLPLQSTYSNHSSVSIPHHNKYKHWTQTEHRLFLLGLERYGQGKWKQISTHLIPSKTPAQVASHAQKYFLRKNVSGVKKRSSIHDGTQVMHQVPSQFNLPYNQMGYFNNGS